MNQQLSLRWRFKPHEVRFYMCLADSLNKSAIDHWTHPIHVVAYIDKTKVPSGVELFAGVPFYVAFPDIIARDILEEIKHQPSSVDDLIAEAQ